MPPRITSLVRLLLDNLADFDAADEHGHTASMLACGYGEVKHVALLIDSGANIGVLTRNLRSSIMFASELLKLYHGSVYTTSRCSLVCDLLSHINSSDLSRLSVAIFDLRLRPKK